ncbi:MAG TPA: dTMP kinase [Nitrososphaerales archaeon]|nr:dTMP kinase [Nitrososphaerales archaeon]
MFISFEGVDGSGKSTQIDLLKINIEKIGYKCVVFKEPGTTLVGSKIRKILKDYKQVGELTTITELFLFAASRSELVDKKIKPNLTKDKTVIIVDRYIDSTLAYQGYGRGFDLDKINYINKIATQGIKPDITFLLDCSPYEGLTRINKSRKGSDSYANDGILFKGDTDKDRFESEGVEFYQAIRSGYLELAKLNSGRWIVINAELPQSIVASEIWDITQSRMGHN